MDQHWLNKIAVIQVLNLNKIAVLDLSLSFLNYYYPKNDIYDAQCMWIV